MKKTYIIPSVVIVNLSASTIICGGGSLDPQNLSGTVSSQSVASGTAGESRDSFWDDDY